MKNILSKLEENEFSDSNNGLAKEAAADPSPHIQIC
jgi:hypothetical protein